SASGDVSFHGFGEYRYGARTQTDPFEDETALNEIRTQGDLMWYHDLFTAQIKADLVYDDVDDERDDVDLETGDGFFDLRQANIIYSPVPWMDLKVGRQILTWGTGDLVFINDLFPKDWQSFFLGRDTEYLKAPSDAIFMSLFPAGINIDIAYSPRFDADRHITGERISYWNGFTIAGQNDILVTDRPNDWFDDHEIAVRVYRNIGAFEVAAYGYSGFWKSPGGVNPQTGEWLFPELGVYGASVRGPVGDGIAHLELGYYDSREDSGGSDPFINNGEARALVGYEREIVRDLTIGVQYYVEHMMQHDDYIRAMEALNMPTASARDEDRHTLTLRITWLAMNQNFVLNWFTRYSPSEEDVYLKPVVTYKVTDRWQASIGADIFSGAEDNTFLGQFENNSNVHASLRYSF
ncbi:hypothetical protein JXA80_00900, partial [bacterium]|nr:hypothetical protein [candidate division CSSED10-310 bacterium]